MNIEHFIPLDFLFIHIPEHVAMSWTYPTFSWLWIYNIYLTKQKENSIREISQINCLVFNSSSILYRNGYMFDTIMAEKKILKDCFSVQHTINIAPHINNSYRYGRPSLVHIKYTFLASLTIILFYSILMENVGGKLDIMRWDWKRFIYFDS